ncbi:MAG: xanthine dehydrogenase family protein molybdopterin-binding subunit [Ilumatobacteraceae bacterium]|nr:xanthine dehydrogenase family protein molybdopterin-binding subunit [Ilumatobacteraceae bacterium]
MATRSPLTSARREDPALLRGEGTFVANLVGPDAAHVAYVLSPEAHGRILSIDVSEASIEGVLGVFTFEDIDIKIYPHPFPGMNPEMIRPMLAHDRVRFVGEPIVAIVAETAAVAADATQRVFVDIDHLDPFVDLESAGEAGTTLFPGIADPVAFRCAVGDEPDFSTCDVVVRQRLVNQRISAAPMEPRSGLAWWESGRLVHYSASQAVHENRSLLAELYELEPQNVRVVSPDVGGSFGAKFRAYPEEALLGWFARRFDRPVAWTETRSESMVGLGHGRGQIQHVTLGGRRDGTIEKYSNHVLQDTGAYPLIAAYLPRLTMTMLTGVYAIEDAAFAAESFVTNTTPVGAYRGAGRPEATTALERAVDMFAAECDLDPADVRRRNFVPSDAFPYRTASGAEYDSGDYHAVLEAALDAVDYDSIRAQQRDRRAAGATVQLGVGISSYVEVTASTPVAEFASVELRSDGTFRAVSSGTPHGQGHATVWAGIIGGRLGVADDRIDVVTSDTDQVPYGVVTGGSRSGQVIGSLVDDAACRLVDSARSAAAGLLEAAVDDVVLDLESGSFHVAGSPSISIGWAELAAATGPLVEAADVDLQGSTFPFGAHIAVVEVDTETGGVDVARFIAVDDAGPILHQAIFEGQIHGGIGGGIAQALMEEVIYDAAGNPRTANFADYSVISAPELPSFELIPSVTPTHKNPLGAKGVGESGTVGSTVAVQNAVVDALTHLGVRHIDLPLTAGRVWQAITDART